MNRIKTPSHSSTPAKRRLSWTANGQPKRHSRTAKRPVESGPRPEDWRAAYHQAGHAVVCHLLSGIIRSLRIDNGRKNLFYDFKRVPDILPRAVLAVLAGPVAEIFYSKALGWATKDTCFESTIHSNCVYIEILLNLLGPKSDTFFDEYYPALRDVLSSSTFQKPMVAVATFLYEKAFNRPYRLKKVDGNDISVAIKMAFASVLTEAKAPLMALVKRLKPMADAELKRRAEVTKKHKDSPTRFILEADWTALPQDNE